MHSLAELPFGLSKLSTMFSILGSLLLMAGLNFEHYSTIFLLYTINLNL